MTAVRGGNVDGVHLTDQVSRIAARPANSVVGCEDGSPRGLATGDRYYLVADASRRVEKLRDNPSVSDNPPAHQPSIPPT